MTASAWLAAAALCWHASAGGGLPRESPACLLAPYAAGETRVRVLVLEGAPRLYLRPQTDAEVADAATGKRLALVSAGALILCQASRAPVAQLAGPAGLVHLQAGAFQDARPGLLIRQRSGGAITLSRGDRQDRRGRYSGDLEITAADRGLRVIEQVQLEDYVAGVVEAELPDSFPLEAMKAQAVAARTYVLFHLGDHARQGADVCGEVHCQAYQGLADPASRACAAARETAGQVLTYKGMLVDAMYHSACGGRTATAWEVRQGKLLPYLRAVSDRPSGGASAYCARGHRVEWQLRLSWQEADRLVASNLGTVLGEPGLQPGPLRSLRLAARGAGGRAQWLEISTDRGTYRVRGDAIRWLFGSGRAGPGGLRSADLEISVARDARGRPRAVAFRGKGHGHGLGMCQWGARGRAQAGQTAAEILTAYYPGARVVDLRTDGSYSGVQAEGTP